MMGQQPKTESLFYYFCLQDQVPEGHLLRSIDRYIDFSFVRERLKDSYSPTGRPSVDPEVLLRLLLVGYLYGISSERRLLEEVKMHLAYRWFTRLGFEQEVPDLSFAKMLAGRRISDLQAWFREQSAITRAHGQPVFALVRSACSRVS
jgi:transposase